MLLRSIITSMDEGGREAVNACMEGCSVLPLQPPRPMIGYLSRGRRYFASVYERFPPRFVGPWLNSGSLPLVKPRC